MNVVIELIYLIIFDSNLISN